MKKIKIIADQDCITIMPPEVLRKHDYHCDCFGGGAQAVHAVNGRFYIAMHHSGFNTPENNANGYASEQAARHAIFNHSSIGRP